MEKYLAILEWIKSRQSLYPMQMEENAIIPDEKIWRLLETANYAPSHKRTEPWRFIVFSGAQKDTFIDKQKEILSELNETGIDISAKLKKLDLRKKQISHVVAICMKRDPKEAVPVCEEEYAVACSVQNMLLSTKSLNIIGYWSTGKTAFSPQMKSFLSLGKADKCMGFLILGVAKTGLPVIPKKQMSEITEKVIWRS